MKKRIVVFLFVLVFAVLFCGSVSVGVDFFYDGGIICFFSPKVCRTNQEVVVPTEIPPTATVIPTLRPTPTQFIVPTLFLTSTPFLDLSFEFIDRLEPEKVNCGRNPYKFNTMSVLWERRFSSFCFGYVHDPFEAIFWGLDYDQVSDILERIGIDHLSKDEQLSKLMKFGLWDSQCNCVPENAPGLSSSLLIPATPTPTPLGKEN